MNNYILFVTTFRSVSPEPCTVSIAFNNKEQADKAYDIITEESKNSTFLTHKVLKLY